CARPTLHKNMANILQTTWHRLTRWLRPKALPPLSLWRGTPFLDAFRQHREPTALELLAELKNTAWSCASINAAVCASYRPRRYVATSPSRQQPAKCRTKALAPAAVQRLRAVPHLPVAVKSAEMIEEVVEHRLLTLLRQVNPVHNSFDLWEITQLYLEVHGCA